MSPEIPLVTAVIDSRSEKIRVTAKMLGRAVRHNGKPHSVEIDVLDSTTMQWTGRTTLAAYAQVEPLNDAAKFLLADEGPVVRPPRA